MTEGPILIGRGIAHCYRTDRGEVWALREVSLALRPGEFVCLVGPSGCGKTTLLRILAGLLRPTQGEVWLMGQPLRGPDRRIGIVFQKDSLLPWRTALENVRLPLELRRAERAGGGAAGAGVAPAGGAGGLRGRLPPGALRWDAASGGPGPRPGRRPGDPPPR